MTQNTYTVTTPDGTVEVKGLGAYHDRDALTIYTDAEGKRPAAVFRRWEHVTVERPEPESSAGPLSADAAELIEFDKKLAAVAPDAAGLLIERAARTGFAAGLDAATKAHGRCGDCDVTGKRP